MPIIKDMSVPHTRTHILNFQDVKDNEDPITRADVRDISQPCQKVKDKNGSTDPREWTYWPDIYDMAFIRAWQRGQGRGRGFYREVLDWNTYDNVAYDNKTEGADMQDPAVTYNLLTQYQREPIVQNLGGPINDHNLEVARDPVQNLIPVDIDYLLRPIVSYMGQGLRLEDILATRNPRSLRLLEVLVGLHRQGNILQGHIAGFSAEEHIDLFQTLRQIRGAWEYQQGAIARDAERARLFADGLRGQELNDHMNVWASRRAEHERLLAGVNRVQEEHVPEEALRFLQPTPMVGIINGDGPIPRRRQYEELQGEAARLWQPFRDNQARVDATSQLAAQRMQRAIARHAMPRDGSHLPLT